MLNNKDLKEEDVGSVCTDYTEEQLAYVNSVKDNEFRAHLLHYVRLLDTVRKDRDAFEKKCSKLEEELIRIKYVVSTNEDVYTAGEWLIVYNERYRLHNIPDYKIGAIYRGGVENALKLVKDKETRNKIIRDILEREPAE